MKMIGMVSLMVLAAGVAVTETARAQAVMVDVGIGSPDFSARVVWGTPVVVVPASRPVVVYEPAPVYHAGFEVVYFERWPVAYWEWVRVHHPARYSSYRRWQQYERAYFHAWRRGHPGRLAELRRAEFAWRRDRVDAERDYRRWVSDRERRWEGDRADRGDDRGRGGRSKSRGRGR